MEFTVAVIVALGVLLLQPTALEAFPRFKSIAGQFDHPRAQQIDHLSAQQIDHLRAQQIDRLCAQQFDHPRVQSNELATTQAVSIVNCGPDGDLVNSILQASLGVVFSFFPNSVQIDIDCGGSCTAVTVEAPVGTIQADVNVCVNPGNTSIFKFSSIFKSSYINPLFHPTDGSVCVTVFAAPQCTPSAGAIPIALTIPVGTAGTGVPVNLMIDIFGANSCVAVQFNAPRCS